MTVFAFSIENFKRATEEVDALMQVAENKLGELLEHGYVASIGGLCLSVRDNPVINNVLLMILQSCETVLQD